MKKLFYLIAFGALLFASCAKTDNPNPNEEKTYSFSIGAEKEAGGTDETRVELIDGLMHWSVGDKVEMHIWRAGIATPLMANFVMTNTHTEPTRSTTFEGELTQSDISIFNPNITTYTYFTHYHGSNASAYVNVGPPYSMSIIAIPAAITMQKNEFPKQHVFMCDRITNAPAATWLENGEQRASERMHFTYKHALAYLRLKINSVGTYKTMRRIFISDYRATRGLQLSGSARVSMTDDGRIICQNTGTSAGATTLTITISNGYLQAGDIVYIPMYPNTFSYLHRLGFEFNPADGSGVRHEVVLPYTASTQQVLEAGKIYDISFNIP